jgi:hypothetical protein
MPPQDKKDKRLVPDEVPVSTEIVHELTAELRPQYPGGWNPKGDVRPVQGTVKKDESGHYYNEVTFTFDAKSPAHPDCLQHCEIKHVDSKPMQDAIEASLKEFEEKTRDPKTGAKTIRFRRVGADQAATANARYFATPTVPVEPNGARAVGHVHNEDVKETFIITDGKPHSQQIKIETRDAPRDVVIATIFSDEELKPGRVGRGTIDHENGHMLGLAHTQHGTKIDSLMSPKNGTQVKETKTPDGVTAEFLSVSVQAIHLNDIAALQRMYPEPPAPLPVSGTAAPHGLPSTITGTRKR